MQDFFRALVNAAQCIVATLAANGVYTLAGGVVGVPAWGRSLVPALAAGLAMQAVNTLSVAAWVAVNEGIPLFATLRRLRAWMVPSHLALIPLALALAMVYRGVGPLGVAFFVLPLLVARHSFKLEQQVRRMFRGTVAALDARDAYTAGHSERVGRLAAALGRELGLPEEEVERLEIAGLLHDVGKIGVPDAVLLKPGRFTPAEYDAMKQHAVLSGQILEGVEELDKVARWVACHHERWDGSGYPRGLNGEEIPLGARILAVADACDAMLSRRSYKDRFTWERTRAELEACAGRDFDPLVVQVMLRSARRPEVWSIIQEALHNGCAQAAAGRRD